MYTELPSLVYRLNPREGSDQLSCLQVNESSTDDYHSMSWNDLGYPAAFLTGSSLAILIVQGN
jgi:hypothetical protein